MMRYRWTLNNKISILFSSKFCWFFFTPFRLKRYSTPPTQEDKFPTPQPTISTRGAFRAIQGNILHWKLPNSTLCNHFKKYGLDFALIQEPHTHKKRFIHWNRLKGTMFTDISNARPRTYIFVKQSNNYSAVANPRFCNQDLTTVRIEYDKNGMN